ncbi:hypothetical protein HPP92_006047 [Vanilla planifolia]|uniref:Uncharacterized protein n=1 Tax=Vanilla planifolia TaxID=51239 RepID=A0A835RJL9_VANPL|nr:hypothetical protein HPP92_006047 [Vanilla planifolia]
MGRGVSSGGGQSSLGYLFGSDEASKPAGDDPKPSPNPSPAMVDNSKLTPAGLSGNTTNNYFRAEGQNTGNFITDRRSTKVHAPPGGDSSLGYLFKEGKK